MSLNPAYLPFVVSWARNSAVYALIQNATAVTVWQSEDTRYTDGPATASGLVGRLSTLSTTAPAQNARQNVMIDMLQQLTIMQITDPVNDQPTDTLYQVATGIAQSIDGKSFPLYRYVNGARTDEQVGGLFMNFNTLMKLPTETDAGRFIRAVAYDIVTRAQA